jgi:light-independent protochlorophyllide reductase subunit B
VIFDTWVHPLMMGLEEHLIGMFRHDFEFIDGHRSHLGDGAPGSNPVEAGAPPAAASPSAPAARADSGPGAGAEGSVAVAAGAAATANLEAPVASGEPVWTADGEAELHKIPFFVRGKVRRNTETFARERGIGQITAETLYDAKAHFSR